MKDPNELRRRAAALIEESRSMQERIEQEDRRPTPEEDQEILSRLEEANILGEEAAKIDKIQRAVNKMNEIVTPSLAEPGILPPGPAAEPRDHDLEARHGFARFVDFAAAVRNAEPRVGGGVDGRLYWAAASGMQQALGSDGGFAVPPAFSTVIWDEFNQAPDNLLASTDQYTVEGESLTLLANAETSRKATYRYGGIQGYWIAEADQMTSSKPKLRQVKIEPQQMAVLVYVTDKLLKGSQIALEQYLTRAAAAEINFLTGDAIIEGKGVGQPLGLLNSGSLITVSKETGQPAATIVSENIVKMWGRLHPRSRANAKWYINVDVEPQLYLMTIGVGTSGLPSYMPPGGLSGAPYATLLGRPVVPLEYCSSLGTLGDIILADLKGYVTGVKGGIESASSMHLRFDYNETCYRFLFDIDGQPWLASALTPFKGTNTLSSHVVLEART